MNTVAVLVSVVAAVALVYAQQDHPSSYVLPDAAELVVGSIQSSFKCEGRSYGYYADTDNGCKVFHVCHPVELADGLTFTARYSFFCGNNTVFDQASLVCTYPDDAIDCAQAQNFYNVNDNLGKQDTPFRQ